MYVCMSSRNESNKEYFLFWMEDEGKVHSHNPVYNHYSDI